MWDSLLVLVYIFKSILFQPSKNYKLTVSCNFQIPPVSKICLSLKRFESTNVNSFLSYIKQQVIIPKLCQLLQSYGTLSEVEVKFIWYFCSNK